MIIMLNVIQGSVNIQVKHINMCISFNRQKVIEEGKVNIMFNANWSAFDTLAKIIITLVLFDQLVINKII